MDFHLHSNFIRQPHEFGSLLSTSNKENHCDKYIIISGKLSRFKEQIKMNLDSLGIFNYRFFTIKGEENCLVTISAIYNVKDVIKIIYEKMKIIDLENLTVKLYEPKDERNLYIKNIPLNYSEKNLTDLFQPYGFIISKKIIRKSNNNNSIGFVRFSTKREAEKAIEDINGKRIILNNNKPVFCEFSKTSVPNLNPDFGKNRNGCYSSLIIRRNQNTSPQNINSYQSQLHSSNVYYNTLINNQLIPQFSNVLFLQNNNSGINNSAFVVPTDIHYLRQYPCMLNQAQVRISKH